MRQYLTRTRAAIYEGFLVRLLFIGASKFHLCRDSGSERRFRI